MRKQLPKIALLGALSFISGYLSLPIGPVPITLQTLVVLLSGVILSPKEAAWSQIIHFLLKFLTMGFGLVILPSFGFLISFPVIASLLSWYYRNYHRESKYLIIGIVMATLLSYVIGLTYMWVVLVKIQENSFTLVQIIQMGMLVFIPGDVVKGLVAYRIAKRIKISY